MGWIIALFVIGICIFVLSSRLYFSFHYVYDHGSEVIQIVVQLFHIRVYRKNIEPEHAGKDRKNKHFLKRIQYMIKTFKQTVKQVHKRYRSFRKTFQDVRVHQLQWVTEMGTGDASTTGMACGGMWAAKGMLTAFLKHNLKQSIHPHIRVTPHYEQSVLTSDAYCIVSMTVGKAIGVWFRIRHVLENERNGCDRKEWFDG